MGTNTQLKYGARLINSYLGDNSTISCCEVLNSLIFPGHEQHHNNSFLCAATVQGQSNMAAGATIGSNHNSRAADGELVAGRGFWPGLCVSIKHNSTFASYTLLAKGDFQYELNIPIPFSLVSNSLDNKELHIMPGYWFSYNLYALARNSEKYVDRDRRMDKSIYLEYDFLAPDTINEMTRGLGILESSVGHAFKLRTKKSPTKSSMEVGRNELLAAAKWIEVTSIYLDNIENSKRSVKLLKVQAAYANFRKLISYYCVRELIELTRANKNYLESLQTLLQKNKNKREEWINAGGQLVRKKALEQLKSLIKIGKIKSWDEVHQWYQQQSKKYKYDKLNHAAAVLLEITRIAPHQLNKKKLIALLEDANETENWIANQITLSRQKDYLNPFRKMLYETDTEMREVIGTLEENPFIQKQNEKRQQFARQIEFIKGLLYNN
jgi:hypothetical protein